MLQATSKQREDQFRSQQQIQQKKNDKYVDSLVGKQANKEQQLEMMKSYWQEFLSYQKQMNDDKFKGNEQKKEKAVQRKLDEIENQRIVNEKQFQIISLLQMTENKILKDKQKIEHIEEIHRMHQEFLSN